MRVSIICSSGTGPRACGAAPASLRARPCGLGLGAGRDRGGGRWPLSAPGHDGAPVPALGSAVLGHRYWGEKEGGKKKVFCFFSVLQITVNPARSALPPTPSPARTPLPCQRNRAGQGDVLLVPWGTCPVSPRGSRHMPRRGTCRTSPSAKWSGRCHMSPDATCQAPMPVPRGTGAAPGRCGAPGWGHAALGGREMALQWCPQGLGLTPGRSGRGGWGWVLSSPLNPLGAKEGTTWLLGPATPLHPTNPARRGAAGLEGPGGGCHTHPLPPPAAPGSAGGPWAALGTLTPPGHPAQSHPINRVQGSLLGMATPGGLGRAPGAN